MVEKKMSKKRLAFHIVLLTIAGINFLISVYGLFLLLVLYGII